MKQRMRYFTKKTRSAGSLSPLSSEEGDSLIETAIACMILIPILLGIVELSFALYCFHYAADAAREGTRFAIVRGANCNGNFGKAYCSPTDGSSSGADGNDIAQYVKGLGFPYSGAVTTTTQWCASSGSVPATWTSCSSTPNNAIGNQVQVTVTYNYPLAIPFVTNRTLKLTSTSSMTIVQ